MPQRVREAQYPLSPTASTPNDVYPRGRKFEHQEESQRAGTAKMEEVGINSGGKDVALGDRRESSFVTGDTRKPLGRVPDTPQKNTQGAGHTAAESDAYLPVDDIDVRSEGKVCMPSFLAQSAFNGSVADHKTDALCPVENNAPFDMHLADNGTGSVVDSEDGCTSFGASVGAGFARSQSPRSTGTNCDSSPEGQRTMRTPMIDNNGSLVSPEEFQRRRYEEYRTMGFIARQELEQRATERKREERLRVEEEKRRELAAGGRWMNRTSRVILARGGRLSPYEDRQSVFERLARAPEVPEPSGPKEFCRTLDGFVCPLFQPMITPRSHMLASRMDRDESPGRRLYRDGEEKLRKWERRVRLADQALRENAAASHVRPVSERILARGFKSRMIKVLSVSLHIFLQTVNRAHIHKICCVFVEVIFVLIRLGNAASCSI